MVLALVASFVAVACAGAARRYLPPGPPDGIVRTRVGFCGSSAGLLLCTIGLWELVGDDGDQATPWFVMGAALIVSAALAASVGGAALPVLFGVWPVVAAVVFLQLLLGPGDGPGRGWLVVAVVCVLLPLAAVIAWIAPDDV